MKLLISILALLNLSVAHAKEIVSNSIEADAEAFIELVMDGEIDRAFEKLVKGSKLFESQPQQIAVSKGQAKSMFEIYDAPIGYELVCRREYSESLISLVYIMKTDLAPITWSLTFYRARNDWAIVGFVFGDQLQGLSECR